MTGSDPVRVTINANNYYGVRHAIETVFQMMEYDEIDQAFVMIDSANVEDFPEFRQLEKIS